MAVQTKSVSIIDETSHFLSVQSESGLSANRSFRHQDRSGVIGDLQNIQDVCNACPAFWCSTGWIPFTSSSIFEFTGDFSVHARVKFNSLSSDQAIFARWNAGATKGFVLGLNSSTQKFTMRISDGTNHDTSSATALAIDLWYDLFFVRSGTTHYFFINGVLDATLTGQTAYDFSIGASQAEYVASLDGSTQLLKGTISLVQMFNRALNAAQVAEYASKGKVNFSDYGGNPSSYLSSGTITIGKRYKIRSSGGSYANVGASDNNVGTEFTATGTAPTTWSTLYQVGNFFDLQPQGISATNWTDYSSTPLSSNTVSNVFAINIQDGANLAAHKANVSNPHSVTKAQVGLSNVTNDAQVKGLASGTTNGDVVTFGADGYTVADSGKSAAQLALLQDVQNAAADKPGYFFPMPASNSDANTAIITINDNANLKPGTGDFSYMWCGKLNSTANGMIFCKGGAYSGAPTSGFLVSISLGKFFIDLYDISTGTAAHTTLSASPYFNKFVSFIFTINRATSLLNFYINGIAVIINMNISLVTDSLDSTYPLYINRYWQNNRFGLTQTCLRFAYFNYALDTDTVVDKISLYRDGGKTDYSDVGGSMTALTSGTLTKGKRYRTKTFVSGDDFSNVADIGVSANASGVDWLCSTITATPANWNHASTLIQLGATLDLEPENITPATWYDRSGNILHGAISNAIAVNLPIGLLARDITDLTKQLQVDMSGITTGNKRTMTIPDSDFTIARNADLTSHVTNTSNPHSVTKAQVGLSNVTNDAQVKGLAYGTTNGDVVTFGADGYTVADSGKSAAQLALLQDVQNAAADKPGYFFPMPASNSDANTAIITINDNANLKPGTGDFSYMWCGKLNSTANGMIFCKGGAYSGAPTSGFLVSISLGKFFIDLYDISTGTAAHTTLSASPYFNKFVSFIFTINRATSLLNFYINGIAVIINMNISLVTDSLDSTYPLYINRYWQNNRFGLTQTCLRFAYFNYALDTDTVVDKISLYRDGGKTDYSDVGGSMTALTSGTLTKGKRYRTKTFVSGDDFSNVADIGVSANASGVDWLCSTITATPANWNHASTLIQLGATLDLEPENISKTLWADVSGNALHGVPNGAIATNERRVLALTSGNAVAPTLIISGTTTIDASLGNNQIATTSTSGSTSLAVANLPTGAVATTLNVVIQNTAGSGSITINLAGGLNLKTPGGITSFVLNFGKYALVSYISMDGAIILCSFITDLS